MRKMHFIGEMVDPEIDAIGEGSKRVPAFGGRVCERFRSNLSHAQGASEDVVVEPARAENLGQAPMGLAAEIVDLPEPVLGLDDSVGEEEIVGIVGLDVWNSEIVAEDGDAGAERRPDFARSQIGLGAEIDFDFSPLLRGG